MENEIMTGDCIFVIPTALDRGIVSKLVFPGMRDEVNPTQRVVYFKRCVAISGDTLEIVNRKVYVNRLPEHTPRNMKFNSSVIKPPDYVDPRIFPKGKPFNEDNYGPVIVPKRGDAIQLTAENFDQWKVFIRREGHSISLDNGKVVIDGSEKTNYYVENDYVFGMGDNRDNSLDSRFVGFFPAPFIAWQPRIVYWSWNPDIPWYDVFDKIASVRWNRIGLEIQ